MRTFPTHLADLPRSSCQTHTAAPTFFQKTTLRLFKHDRKSSCSDAARERRRIQAQPRNALPCALQYVMPTVSCADLTRLWCTSWGAVTISVIAKVGCCCEERVGGWCWGVTSTTLARLEPRVGDSIAFVVIYCVVFSTLLHRTHRSFHQAYRHAVLHFSSSQATTYTAKRT